MVADPALLTPDPEALKLVNLHRLSAYNMRIYILISDDVMFKPSVLFKLLQRRGAEVCGVAEVKAGRLRKAKKSRQPTPIQWLGLKGFFVLGFYQRLLRFLQHFPLPPFIKIRFSNREVCSLFKIAYEYVPDVNDPSFTARLSSQRPDVLVSIQPQIFSPALLSIPKIACINCHQGKLPDYRGASPIFTAMLHGEKTLGVTVHTMTEKLDVGAILCRKEFPNSRDRSLLENVLLAHELFPDAIIESLESIEKKGTADFPWVSEHAPYYKLPTRKELGEFRRTGLKMIWPDKRKAQF